MTIALTPGTFDPITNGHLDIIKRAAALYEQVIVAVAQSTPKHTLFTIEERTAFVEEVTQDIPNVSVVSFDGLLVDLAKQKGASVFVKGLRAITDFEYEFQMSAVNHHLDEGIETSFIMSPPKYMYLSSSIVRELAALGGDTSDFVPPVVNAALRKKFTK